MKFRALQYWSHVHYNSFSAQVTNGPNKLERYITLHERLASDKHLSSLGPSVS
jgi:hypothetical protein